MYRLYIKTFEQFTSHAIGGSPINVNGNAVSGDVNKLVVPSTSQIITNNQETDEREDEEQEDIKIPEPTERNSSL